MKNLITYKNDPDLKASLIKEVEKHRKADQIIQGTYGRVADGMWQGCAVGCAIHSLNNIQKKDFATNDHGLYESELGIPRILARLEDRIFEGLPREKAKDFPLRFAKAVPVGVDLSLVWPKFAIWLLGDKKDGVLKYAKNDNQKKVIQDVINLYKRKVAGKEVDQNEFKAAAADAADAYAAAAAGAYAAGAYAAGAADAAAYAAGAADAAAYAADYAAYAADYAYAAAYAAADYAARQIHYEKCADKLIKILKTTK